MARETCKETLLRKASEADAHVVSFGWEVGGLRPSDASQGGYLLLMSLVSNSGVA